MKDQLIIDMIKGHVMYPAAARQFFANLPDGRFMITVEPWGDRSLSQNAYYHGVMLRHVLKGLQDAGWEDMRDINDAKAEVARIFLTVDIVNSQTGEMKKHTRGTHSLSKYEMSRLFDDVVQWGIEYLNIEIPYPNECLKRGEYVQKRPE